MKQLILYITLLSAGILFGQKPMVLLDVDPKEAKPGEILTITVKSNVRGEIDIEFPAGFVHGYKVMNGMEQEMDYNTGKVVTYYYMSQTGAMNKEGTYTFGPAYIKKGSKVYRSNTVSVTIKKEDLQQVNSDEITTKQLRQPAFGVIDCSRRSIYEGEPVVLSAKVYSHFNPSHLEDYQTYSINGVIEKHEVGNNQRILVEEVRMKGVQLYTFTYDKNVLFPTGTGKIRVEPYKLLLRRGFDAVPVTSSGSVIEVKPLPKPPADFSGGVGAFNIERSISGTKFKQGEVLTMTLTISGHGNLHNLLEPVLQLPKGFIVYGDPVIKENFNFTSRGAEGSVSYEYHIQITRHGKLSFPGTTLSYFDPEKEKYIRINTSGQELEIEKNSNFKSTPDEEIMNPATAEVPEIGPMRAENGNTAFPDPFGSRAFLALVASPLLLAFVLGLFYRKKGQAHVSKQSSTHKGQVIQDCSAMLRDANAELNNGNHQQASLLVEKVIHKYLRILSGKTEDELISKTDLLSAVATIDEAIARKAQNILEQCEQARYGMGSDTVSAELIQRTEQLISNKTV